MLLLIAPLVALAAPSIRTGSRASRMALHRPHVMRKLAMRSEEAAAAAPPAPAAPAKDEWKGLESMYGGLKDDQVFTEYGWDPANFAKKATKQQLMMWREAELTHGRVAMLASWGILCSERWHPLFNSPDGTAMEQFGYIAKNYPGFIFAAGLTMGAIELLRSKKVFKNGGTKGSFIFRPYSADAMTIKEDVLPGDLGYDPLEIKPDVLEGPGGLLERQNQEINNGRLAMLATAGILAAEAASGVPQG